MVLTAYFYGVVEQGLCLQPVVRSSLRYVVGRRRLLPLPCWRHLGVVVFCETQTLHLAVEAVVVSHASVADSVPLKVTHLSCSVAWRDTVGGSCIVPASSSVAQCARHEWLSLEGR